MDDQLFTAGMLVAVAGLSTFVAGGFGPIVVGVAAMFVAAVERDAEPATDRQSCPNCGARNDASDDVCHYCDAAL